MTQTRAGFALLWLAAFPACATTFAESPRRPAAESATVESKDTVIDEIDGKSVQKMRGERSVYLLPPGPHVIGISFLKVTPGFFTTRIATSKDIRVCLRAEAGQRYVTAARLDGTAWSPQIIERARGEVPNIRCDPDGASSEPEILKRWSGEGVSRARLRPFLDLMLNVGFAFGGDNVVTVPVDNTVLKLAAGQGVAIGFGVLLTPLWLGDRIGFGAGAEVGVRYDSDSTSNAGVSITRYPGVATLHALVRAGQSWFVLLAGGVERDFRISLSGSGEVSILNGDAVLTSRTGALGRVGFYYRWTDGFALTFGVGYTKLSYDAPLTGASIDASHASVWTNLHWAL